MFNLLLIAGVSIQTFALYNYKNYIKSGNNSYLFFGLCLSILVSLIFIHLLRSYPLWQANSVWNMISILLVVVLGAMVFKEKISMKQCTGIALAIVAIILLD